jgi:tetratricopeptide (TPR) repeat protein
MRTSLSSLPLSLLLLATGCGRSPSYYLNKGNQLVAQSKYADAELNFRKAILRDASFGEAYYQLGLAELKLGKGGDAYRALGSAAKLLPARDDVKIKLADLSLAIYQADRRHPQAPYDQAVSISDQLLAKNPQSYDGLRIKGNLSAAAEDRKDAEEFYRQANAVKPMQPEIILGWTQALFQDGRIQEAGDLAQGFLAQNKSYGPIYEVLYRQRLRSKDLAGAEQILRAKHANLPADAGTILELASLYAGTGRQAEMKAALQQMLDNPKSFPQASLEAGDFYRGLRRWDDARQVYEAGAQASSGKGDKAQRIVYLKRIAGLWDVQGRGDEARRVADEILKEQPGDLDATTLEAAWLISTGKPEDTAKALSLVQPLVTKNPENAALHFTLGRSLVAKGEASAARTEFLAAAQKNRNFIEPRLALAEMGERQGDYRTVLRYANEILALNSNLRRVRVLRAVSLIHTGNDSEGRKELAALEESNPQDREVQLQLAALALRDKNFQQAEKHFRQLTTEDRGDLRPLTGLTATLAAEGQIERAVALLQAEVQKAPNNGELRYLLASTAVAAAKFDLGIQEFQHLAAISSQPAALYVALGNAYRLKGDTASALSSFEKAASLTPKDPLPVVSEAEVLIVSGRGREALEKYRTALQLAPNEAVLLNNVAFLLADTGGSLDEALRYARRARELDAKQPRFSDTLGWIYLKQNLSDSALQVFRALTQSNPDNPTFHYHLGMAFLQKGDKNRAKAELQTALAKKPSPDVRRNVEAALAKLG